jgi:hypothetical protein
MLNVPLPWLQIAKFHHQGALYGNFGRKMTESATSKAAHCNLVHYIIGISPPQCSTDLVLSVGTS